MLDGIACVKEPRRKFSELSENVVVASVTLVPLGSVTTNLTVIDSVTLEQFFTASLIVTSWLGAAVFGLIPIKEFVKQVADALKLSPTTSANTNAICTNRERDIAFPPTLASRNKGARA
jgi:hypothetical protein